MKLKYNLVYLYVFCIVTMFVNIYLTSSNTSWHSMVFFTKVRIFIFVNKMEQNGVTKVRIFIFVNKME